MASTVPVGSLPQLVPAGPASGSPGAALASLHSGIDIRNGPCGTGGFATQDIACNETIGFVSYDYILSETYAIHTPIGRVAWAMRADSPLDIIGRTVLYLVMIAEREDSSAKFHSYMKSLPAEYDDAVCWHEDELSSYLSGTNLAEGARNRRAWLLRCYNAFFPRLAMTHPQLFPAHVFTYGAFQWAHSSFSSRCFPHLLSVPLPLHAPLAPPQAQAQAQPPSAEPGADVNPFGYADGTAVGCMLPVVDVLNHRPRTSIGWVRGREGVSFVAQGKGMPQGEGALFCKAGEEVFNNYGPKSNEELVLGYGFALAGNIDDTYSLVTRGGAAVEEHEGEGEGTLGKACRLSGLPSRHVLTRKEATHTVTPCIPPSLLSFLRLTVLQEAAAYYHSQHGEGEGEQPPACLQAYSSACSGAGDASALQALLSSPLGDASSELRMLSLLHAQLSARLAKLQSCHPWLGKAGHGVGDLPSLQHLSSRSPYRARIAQCYIQGQRDILQDACACCESMMRGELARLLVGAGVALGKGESRTSTLYHTGIALPPGCTLHPLLRGSQEAGLWVAAGVGQGSGTSTTATLGDTAPPSGSEDVWTPLLTLPSLSCTPIMSCTLAQLDGELGQGLGLQEDEGEGEQEGGDIATTLVLQAYHLALWLYRRWSSCAHGATGSPPQAHLTALCQGLLQQVQGQVGEGEGLEGGYSWEDVQGAAQQALEALIGSDKALWRPLLGIRGRNGKSKGVGVGHAAKRARKAGQEEGVGPLSVEQAASLLGMAFLAVVRHAVPIQWGRHGYQLALLPVWPQPLAAPTGGGLCAWFVQGESEGGAAAVQLCVPTSSLVSASAKGCPLPISLHPSFPSLSALHAVQALDSPPVPCAWAREMEEVLAGLLALGGTAVEEEEEGQEDTG